MTNARFWIGNNGDGVLEPHHVGELIMLDHYKVADLRPEGSFNMNTHVGILDGYIEKHGVGTYAASDIGFQSDVPGDAPRIEYPDISMHTDLGLVILFRDGRRVEIGEEDYASIWVPNRSEGTTP